VKVEAWQASLPSFSSGSSGRCQQWGFSPTILWFGLAAFSGMPSMWRSRSQSTNGWLHFSPPLKLLAQLVAG